MSDKSRNLQWRPGMYASCATCILRSILSLHLVVFFSRTHVLHDFIFLPAMAPIAGVTVGGNNDSQNKHSNSSSKTSSRSGSSAPGGGDSHAANGVNGAENNRLWAKLLTEGKFLEFPCPSTCHARSNIYLWKCML